MTDLDAWFGRCLLTWSVCLSVQDEGPMWAERALHALQGIASHAVNFEFARPAAAPIASRQLAQAWQAFQAAVTRGSSSPEDGPTSAAGVPAVAATAAASSAAPAASTAAMNGVAYGVAGVSQHGQAADEPEDEEVCIISKVKPVILSCRLFSCCVVYATVPDYVFSLLPGENFACNHQQGTHAVLTTGAISCNCDNTLLCVLLLASVQMACLITYYCFCR